MRTPDFIPTTLPDGPRVIAGFGRSGTTWIQDVVAEANSLRAVFEPLHPLQIKTAKRFAHRCLRPNDKDDDLYQFLDHYFHGDFWSLWADYRIVKDRLWPSPRDLISVPRVKVLLRQFAFAKNNLSRFHSQRRFQERLTKFVRANMMLSWLQRNFRARIVFVIRHPAAVVQSQMRAQHAWNLDQRFEIYRGDERLLSILNEKSKEMLFKPLETVEAFTLSWCIENSIAIQQATESGIHIAYYENLVQGGEEEWIKILSALGLERLPDRSLIFRPSQQAWGKKASDPGLLRQHDSWRKEIKPSTAKCIQNVLDATGMHIYTLRNSLPTPA